MIPESIRRIARPLVRAFNFPRNIRVNERKRLQEQMVHLFRNDPVLHIAEFEGEFQLDVRSRLFGRMVEVGYYEPKLIAIAKRSIAEHSSSKDIIDIGANVGFYSCLFAKQVPSQQVLAVEPVESALKRLKSNLERNGVSDRVKIYEGVASDSEGSIEMTMIQGQEEFSSIGSITHPSADQSQSRTVTVASQTLNNLVAQNGLRPGFVKVDTEGAEHLVFSGAKETLREFRPIILSELSDPLLRDKGSSAAEVIEMIRSANYKVVDPLRLASRPGVRDFGDILAVPAEIADRFFLFQSGQPSL